MNNQSSDTTPPAGIKLSTDQPLLKLDKMPWEQSLSEWQASLPWWLRQLVELTPSERKQRLTELSWYGTPELRRQIIRGDFAQLKADHEAQVRAWIQNQATLRAQFVLRPTPPPEPKPLETAFWRRPELALEFEKFWAEADAKEAAEKAAAAQVAKDRAEAEDHGFCYPVDSTQGVSFKEALAWTVGCVGPGKRGYQRVDKFRAWLERVEYRYLNTGRITRKGFNLVLQNKRAQTCKYQTAWRRAQREQLTNQDPNAVNKGGTPTSHCLECGQFLTFAKAKYCSSKCKQAAYRKRHRYG
jgi:hypothetical protein